MWVYCVYLRVGSRHENDSTTSDHVKKPAKEMVSKTAASAAETDKVASKYIAHFYVRPSLRQYVSVCFHICHPYIQIQKGAL